MATIDVIVWAVEEIDLIFKQKKKKRDKTLMTSSPLYEMNRNLLVDESHQSAKSFDVESLSEPFKGFVRVEGLVDRRRLNG